MDNHNECLKPGTQLSDGRFVIDRLMAVGGFSYIYEGRFVFKYDLGNEIVSLIVEEKPIVIKELYLSDRCHREPNQTTIKWNDENSSNDNQSLSDKIKSKTRSEALKLRQLSSPYILKIIGAIEENNTIYQITEKIEGAIDFKKKLNLSNEKSGNKLQVKEAVRYITQVSEALKEVHSKNIVHLDIKPENVLCDHKDNAILIDFGISMTIGENFRKTTVLSAASRPWSPPEQYNIKDDISSISFSTDIYALGQTFFAFLTGVVPPDFSSITCGSEILLAPSEYNKGVNDYLDAVVLKCIEIRRDKRYQTIEEFLTALDGEKEYQNIIDKAKKAGENKDFEKGIYWLNYSEKYIPLSAILQDLRFNFQDSLKQQKKQGDYVKQQQDALNYIGADEFEKALAILELLPTNEYIQEQIELCKTGINKKRKDKHIVKAKSFLDNKQYEQALDEYKEAKKIDQKDASLDEEIEILQSLISDIEKNKNYNKYIQQGNSEYNNKNYKDALNFYNLAKENATISSLAVDKKIEDCVKNILLVESIETDKQNVKKDLRGVGNLIPFEKISDNIIDAEISKANKIIGIYNNFKRKYPSDISFDNELKKHKSNQEELEQLSKYFKAEKLFKQNKLTEASYLLNNIHPALLPEKARQLHQKISNAQNEEKETQIKQHIEKSEFNDAVQIINTINSKASKKKWLVAIAQKKIDIARDYFDKGLYNKALEYLKETNDETSKNLNDLIVEKIKEQQDETKLNEAKNFVEKGKLEQAKTLLFDVKSSSQLFSEATKIISDIENQENKNAFAKGRQCFSNGDYKSAIDYFSKVTKQSDNLFLEAKKFIKKSKQKLLEATYTKIINDANSLIDGKKYKEAESLLMEMSGYSSLESKRQDLLKVITAHKKSSKKKLFKYAAISVAVIVLFLGLSYVIKNCGRIESFPSLSDWDTIAQVEISDSIACVEKYDRDMIIADSIAQVEKYDIEKEKKEKAKEEKAKEEKLKKERIAKEEKERKVREEEKMRAIANEYLSDGDTEFKRGKRETAYNSYKNANYSLQGSANYKYSKFLDYGRRQVDNMGGCAECKKSEACRKDVIANMNWALGLNPNCSEARTILNCLK